MRELTPVSLSERAPFRTQQFLNFLPLPQLHLEFLPCLTMNRRKPFIEHLDYLDLSECSYAAGDVRQKRAAADKRLAPSSVRSSIHDSSRDISVAMPIHGTNPVIVARVVVANGSDGFAFPLLEAGEGAHEMIFQPRPTKVARSASVRASARIAKQSKWAGRVIAT
jgi:hypothetical protein